jgi:hypothetical protein
MTKWKGVKLKKPKEIRAKNRKMAAVFWKAYGTVKGSRKGAVWHG